MTSRDYTSFVGNLSAPDHFSQLYYSDPSLTPPSSVNNVNVPVEGTGAGAGAGDNVEGQHRANNNNNNNNNNGILLIGAKNLVYKLAASELRLTQTLLWTSSDSDRESCLVKGKDRDKCQNYISVMQQYSDDPNRYLICGTNAFKPMCREYLDERGSYVLKDERTGLGLAPFDPYHNSTAVLVGEELYSGTVADFTGVDPIIFRKPLRTQQYDSTQLNSPDFVGSLSHEVMIIIIIIYNIWLALYLSIGKRSYILSEGCQRKALVTCYSRVDVIYMCMEMLP